MQLIPIPAGDDNDDGGGDSNDETAAFSEALAQRNDGNGAATLLPDLRRRCDGGDA